MIQTLKRRFVFYAMAVVTCLLLFIVIALNSMNWMMLNHRTDQVLDTLVQADGVFHKMEFERPGLSINRPQHFNRPVDMDQMQASRFFVVCSDANGIIQDVNTDKISAVDQTAAWYYGQRALAQNRTSGEIDSYKYTVKELEQKRLLFFIDISNEQESFRTVLMASIAIALLCWVVLLVIAVLLSGRVLAPVIAAMEKQKQFITNAGHEMKTPLAIIQSNNDTMALIHGENKYNVHIGSQTKRLNGLMNNLLLLARLDESAALPTAPVQLSQLVQEQLPVYRETAREKALTLQTDIAPELTLQANRDLLCQLLTILLDNAMKYTLPGGTVSLTLTRQGRHLRLVTENTCDTTQEPEPEKLFERFYRGDAARTQQSDTSGYGIGLSAARAICQQLGGTLTADYPAADTIRFTAVFPGK